MLDVEEIEYEEKQRINERGNIERRSFVPGDRYKYDFEICHHSKGWVQYDTKQDSWYFGIWVHPERRLIFTYAEGDVTLTLCTSEESYHQELKHMAAFYGTPPPAYTVISDDGTITNIYDKRPE